jgi:hypothetical protein
MEPATVTPMDLEEDDMDLLSRNDTMEDINSKTLNEINILKENILTFKRALFEDTVSNDTTHAPSNMEAMIEFQSLFLHCISYWLSILNTKRTPVPEFENSQHKNMFIKLTKKIHALQEENSDAYVLVYNLLFQFTQQHPFDMGKRQK